MDEVYTVCYSEDVCEELKKRGATEETLSEIAAQLVNYPRKDSLTVDTSDKLLSFEGYYVSFLRDHIGKMVWIFTNKEGLSHDKWAGKASIQYSEALATALKKMSAAGTDELETIE